MARNPSELRRRIHLFATELGYREGWRKSEVLADAGLLIVNGKLVGNLEHALAVLVNQLQITGIKATSKGMTEPEAGLMKSSKSGRGRV